MKFLFRTGCFSLFTAFLWASAFAASGPIIVNVDVPSGQWKAARLKNLLKDATVAVQVESTGEILIALIHAKAFKNSPDNLRPLFTGRLERKLSFSVAIAEKGDRCGAHGHAESEEPPFRSSGFCRREPFSLQHPNQAFPG